MKAKPGATGGKSPRPSGTLKMTADQFGRRVTVGKRRAADYRGAEGPKKPSPRPGGVGKGGGKGTPGNKRGR